MTKEEIIDKTAGSTGCMKITVSVVLEAILDNITKAVAHGETVQFANFGTFGIKTAIPKIKYDFSTRSSIKIPGKAVPVFKPGKELKEAVTKNERRRQ